MSAVRTNLPNSQLTPKSQTGRERQKEREIEGPKRAENALAAHEYHQYYYLGLLGEVEEQYLCGVTLVKC